MVSLPEHRSSLSRPSPHAQTPARDARIGTSRPRGRPAKAGPRCAGAMRALPGESEAAVFGLRLHGPHRERCANFYHTYYNASHVPPGSGGTAVPRLVPSRSVP